MPRAVPEGARGEPHGLRDVDAPPPSFPNARRSASPTERARAVFELARPQTATPRRRCAESPPDRHGGRRRADFEIEEGERARAESAATSPAAGPNQARQGVDASYAQFENAPLAAARAAEDDGDRARRRAESRGRRRLAKLIPPPSPPAPRASPRATSRARAAVAEVAAAWRSAPRAGCVP